MVTVTPMVMQLHCLVVRAGRFQEPNANHFTNLQREMPLMALWEFLTHLFCLFVSLFVNKKMSVSSTLGP